MEDEEKKFEFLLGDIPRHISTPRNIAVNHGYGLNRPIEGSEQVHALFHGDASLRQSLIEREKIIVNRSLNRPVERPEQDHTFFNGDTSVQQNLVEQENPTNHQNLLFPEGFCQGFEKNTSVGDSIASLPSDERFLLCSPSNYCPLEAAFSHLTLERQDMGFDARGVYSPAAATGFGGVSDRETCSSLFGVSGGSSSRSLGDCAPPLGFYSIDDRSTNPQVASFFNHQSRNKSFGSCELQHNQFAVGSSNSQVPPALSSSPLRSIIPLIHRHNNNQMNQQQYYHNQLQAINLERQLKAQNDYAVAQKAVARAYATSFADPAPGVSTCDASGCSGQGSCSSRLHWWGSSLRSGNWNNHIFADGVNENNTIPCSVDYPCHNFLNLRNGDGKFSKYCPCHFQNSHFEAAEIFNREDQFGYTGKVFMSGCSPGLNNIKNTLELPNDFCRCGSHYSGKDNCKNCPNALIGKPFQLVTEGPPSEVFEAKSSPSLFTGYHQQHKEYTSLNEVKGQMVSVAKDQHGCRFLQKKLEDGSPEEIQMMFSEINDSICKLMIDPYGNYLVQKLLDVCNEEQRMEVILAVTRNEYELVDICLKIHGTRAVQKLIDVLTTPEQISLVMSALRPGAVPLIKDLNGNHVVQRCLQRFSNEDIKFLLTAAADHCVEIATHRHGCCVLQQCVHYAKGEERRHLVAQITINALVLSQDPFGNYVVQYILDMQMPWATRDVLNQLRGNYACLSMQKFSSNVVEKCLKEAGQYECARIVNELLGSPNPLQLLQDPYANYVIQSALEVSKGASHAAIVDMLHLHLPVLHRNPYGKKILARIKLKR